MKKTGARLNLSALVLTAALWTTHGQAAGILLEAEAHTASGGGSFTKATDRAASSGGSALIGWDATGQWLEWKFDVAEAGDYQVMLRYAAGRKWVVWRELQLDGAVPDGFAKIELANTGGWGRSAGEWRNYVVGGDKPQTLKLSAGSHTLRLTSTGGAGENGSANIDAVVLVSAGTAPDAVLKP